MTVVRAAAPTQFSVARLLLPYASLPVVAALLLYALLTRGVGWR